MQIGYANYLIKPPHSTTVKPFLGIDDSFSIGNLIG